MNYREITAQNNFPKPLIWLGLVAIVVGVLLAYGPAVRGGFVWNDNTYVHENRLLEEPTFSNLIKIWSLRWVLRADGQQYYSGYTEQYYPMVFTSFWLESHLWGNKNPTGFHVVNVLLHIVNASLVWLILHRLKFPWAWLVAVIFALHPVAVESVAWITERKNVLSGAFYLLAMLSYLRFERDGRRSFYIAALACFVLGLLSKTVVCTLPAVLLLVLWRQKGRVGSRDFVRLIPFFVVGAALGGLTAYLEQHSVGAVGSQWQIAFWQRFVIAGKAVFFYTSKLLWPIKLSFIYPRWNPSEFSALGLLWPTGVVGVAGVLWRLRKHIGHAPSLGWAGFVITLFPALGFFNVYPFRYSFVADHFQYLASIFFIALCVWLAYRLYKYLRPQAFSLADIPIVPVMLVCVLLLVLGGLTYIQASSYKDIKTLWQDTTRKNPRAWMAWNNLGAVYMQERDFSAAADCFKRLLELRDDYASAQANYGQLLALQGEFNMAVRHLRRAIELEPNYGRAHLKLADVYAERREYELAIATYKKAIDLAAASSLLSERGPTRIKALSHLASVYAETGQYNLAVSRAEQALELARKYGERGLAEGIERQWRDYRELNKNKKPPDKSGTTLRSSPLRSTRG